MFNFSTPSEFYHFSRSFGKNKKNESTISNIHTVLPLKISSLNNFLKLVFIRSKFSIVHKKRKFAFFQQNHESSLVDLAFKFESPSNSRELHIIQIFFYTTSFSWQNYFYHPFNIQIVSYNNSYKDPHPEVEYLIST